MKRAQIPCKAIRSLNLDCIINRLTDPQTPKNIHGGWSGEEAKKIAEMYKVFLYLEKKYKNETIIPFREVDEFWHNHILFTKKYTQDCQKIFGEYLHHTPHKQETKKDKEFYAKTYARTLELLKKEFPELN